MKTYLFTLATNPADAAGDGVMFAADTFLGMNITDDNKVTLNFKKVNGTLDVSTVVLTHTAAKGKEVMQIVAATMAGGADMIDVVDLANAAGLRAMSETTNLITAVTLSL
tara:strand:+ start:513 stop:842 length:330 start_codon:yes stop_codon:yes gene_type:complete